MHSKLYIGNVQHNRFSPKVNCFKYQLFMMYIDLDELPTLFNRFIFWSKDRFNLASFKTSNYLADNNGCIKNGVRAEIKSQTGLQHQGPIRMLTHLSYFGFCFNPVTFYYCFDKQDKRVEFVVAQINNTPWDERYSYVIQNNDEDKIAKSFDKAFHVSPFLPMDMRYFWKFGQPKQKLDVYMKNTQQDKKIFDVVLRLKSKPLNSKNLALILFRFPFMTFKVVGAIYWQSLILWLKRIPFYSHPKLQQNTAAEQQDNK
jgi:uncharacterized protein